ncbi:hypothetical protein PHISCL_08821 [Aspergillus sclerotialis]|uniref:Uncharacterized protein n=1 Tax=Aspergillus sclerotialis TaxID=2070753 RepID=A0A3A2Z6X9_9EURO|nr:hypothetical protein PHISCL_08821 [Aspergillus sclerotialis]
MQSNYSDPEALKVLSSSINQTLVETGRYFRSKGNAQTRAHLLRHMPIAQEQFNLALDDLSEQIFMAKAFLERDYDALKAKKVASQQPAEDVEMTEAEVKPQPEPLPESVKKEEEKQPVTSPVEVETPEAKPAVSEEKTIAQPADEKPSQVTHVDLTETKDEAEPEPTEINFDSVLNDTGGANEFDLHLDFGDDDIGNQNFLSGTNMVDSGIGSGADNAPGVENNTANTSIGGDAFDIELQKANAPDPSSQGQGQADNQGSNNQEDMMAPGQSSFDDLFMDHDSMGDPNFLEGDGLMNINELDDSWFT